ncbi:MAG: hypothetical protein IJH12_04575 [Clostridia bacterium]|nr:hypothetical protein [Clostridia bacterium]
MTKEEFISSLSKSDDKISIIKEIKSMGDVGLRFSSELTEILCKCLSKEEIFKIITKEDIKERILTERDKFKLLLSLSNEDILGFIKENGNWMKENGMNVSDITIRMNPNQQVEFVRELTNSDAVPINELREVVALMKTEAKSKISIEEIPDECKEAYKIEMYDVFESHYRYGKIKIDLDGDLSRYRGLDRLICLGGDNTDFEKMKSLIEVCPSMKVYDEDDGKGYSSTADEYITAKEWIDKCISQIPEDYTALQKIALVDNMIGQQFCYSPDYETETHNVEGARAVWKVIASKKGVCIGLSKVEEIMLKRLGVNAELILAPGHAFIKVNGLEIKKADGTVETGNSIIDPTWNLAAHRFKGMPTNFLVSYKEIRKHDIFSDGIDHMGHKNDRALSDANFTLDEHGLRDLYKSVGLANENGIFPIAEMNEMSDNMNEYKRNNPQENIDGQLRILKKFCPEFNSYIYESTKILRNNLLNKENMGIKKMSISKIRSKIDEETVPLICVYAIENNGHEIFFVADKESNGFKNYSREEFLEQFERFQADIEINGQRNPWDREEKGESKIKNECESER